MKILVSLLFSVWLAGIAAAAPPMSPDQLVAACRAGDLAKARSLLGASGKANVLDREGHSPLLAAIFSRNAPLVALLLSRGAQPNEADRCPENDCPGHPALIFAVYLNEPKIVQLLLDAKADLAWKNHMATRRANVEAKVEVFKVLRAAGGKTGLKPEAASAEPAAAAAGEPKAQAAELSQLLPAEPSAATRSPGARLRIALVPEDSTQPMADLLAADLTAANFELVEREQLQRVIEEQSLAGQLGVNPARAPQLGSLVGADALVLLRKVTVGEQPLLEMRVVRVSPGIVLYTGYRPWPLADAQAWSKDTAQRLASLDGKVRGARGIALSPADFRPATNTPAAVSLAREAALLISERLVRQPEVIVLERAAIAGLAREKILGAPGEFWAGSFLVDGTAEAALDASNEATLTLRLQPVDNRPPQTFTARGPRAGLGSLVDSLVAQAAKALALAPAAPLDPAREAQTHFAESRDAYARSLFLSAWRHAEMAALLGLRTPEFIEWRLQATLGIIGWQARRFHGDGGLRTVVWAGWDEDWINASMGGNDWLRPQEWLEAGLQCAQAGRVLLKAAIDSGDTARIQAAIEKQEDVVAGSLTPWDTLYSATGLIEHAEALTAIVRTLQETFVESLAAADLRPDLAQAQSMLAVALARYSGFFYPEKAGYQAFYLGLLKRHFAFEDLATRSKIRGILMTRAAHVSTASLRVYTGSGSSHVESITSKGDPRNPSLPALAASVKASAAPEDELMRSVLGFQIELNSPKRIAISEQLFAWIGKNRALFVKEPQTFYSLLNTSSWFGGNSPDAPKFLTLNTHGGATRRTPEWLKLRRDIFLLVAREAEKPAPAWVFLDSDYHPADEDPAELARLTQKVNESSRRALLNAEKIPGTPAAATPAAPKPALAKTPTYAAYPPLKVTRSWNPMLVLQDWPDWHFNVSGAPTTQDGKLWLFGSNRPEAGLLQQYLFEIALPSLETTLWTLPEMARSKGPGEDSGTAAGILVEADRVFLAKSGEFFAVLDRRTRQWQINRDLQPVSAIVRAGADLFFLTQSLGARGLVRYSPEGAKAELLASNRRTPLQTPLDDPAIQAQSLRLLEDGRLEMITGHAEVKGGSKVAGNIDSPQGKVTYDPAARTWGKLEVLPKPDTSATGGVPTLEALAKPGWARAYVKSVKSNVWTLQLPRESMPKVRIPVELVRNPNPGDAKEPVADVATRWFWTGQGYVIYPRLVETGEKLWFLPKEELDAYLDSHVPGEDESSSIAPKAATPR